MANEVLIPVKYVVDDSDLTKAGAKVGALTAEEKKLEAEMNDVAAAARRQATAFNQAGDAGTKAAKDTEKQYNMLGNSIGNIGSMIAGAFAVDRILSLGKAVVDITAEFQKFKAVLTTSLGSGSEAERALLMIQNFAAKTPFAVAELTEAYVKFANRGLKLTATEMKALGDLASSTGKSFDQLTEAALDAMTGENERLKEFGIQAQKTGETTQYTFKGVTTEVKNTDAAVREYLISLGEVEGVTGSMSAISETLTGKISNLGDSFDRLFLTLGNQTSGVMGGTISLINEMVNSVTTLLTTTEQLGKEQSAGAVSAFSTKVSAEFKKVADEAKKTGQSVQDALDWKSADIESGLNKELEEAEKRLRAFQEERAGLGNSIAEVIDFSGNTILTNKSLEATFASEVQRIKGQLDSLTEAKKNALKPDPNAEKAAKDAAEKALKAAEEAAKKYKANDRITFLGTGVTKYISETGEETIKEIDFLAEESQNILKKWDSEHEKKVKDQIKRTTDAAAEELKIKEDLAAADKKLADEQKAYKDQLTSESIALASFAADAYVQFSGYETEQRISQLQQQSEWELQMTGDNLEARKRIEDSYNKRIAREKEDQAKKEKAAALFQVSINTATSIIKTGAELGYPAALPFQVIAGIQGAVQAAIIASKPVPKFYFKGTRFVDGPDGIDQVPAMLTRGERVITADKNKQLSPAFDVLTNSKLPASVWNQTLMDIEKLGVFTPPKIADLPQATSSNADLLAELQDLKRVIKGLPIEQHIHDERGYRRRIKNGDSYETKLNKRYGFE